MSQSQNNNTAFIHHPHDALFKHALQDKRIATAFFLQHLPKQWAQRIDFKTLKLQNVSFLDEELRKTAADVLYLVQMHPHLADTPGTALSATGAQTTLPCYLYALVEAQKKPDKWLPLRKLDYIVSIAKRHHQQYPSEPQLPVIFPLIFYIGKTPYRHSTKIADLFNQPELFEQLMTQALPLVALHQIPDEDLFNHPWTAAMSVFLKHAQTRDALQLLQHYWDLTLAPLLAHEAYEQAATVLNYLMSVGKVAHLDELTQFLCAATHQVYPEMESKVMTIADQFRQQGMQQGMQESVYRLVLKRFNQVPDALKARLEQASQDELSQLFDQVLDAQSVSELLQH